jgi:hypothetical protein
MVTITDIVGNSLSSFLDLALTFTSIMLIYYIGKFFFVAPPTKEEREATAEADKKRRTENFNWIKDKIGEGKKKAADKTKEEARKVAEKKAESEKAKTGKKQKEIEKESSHVQGFLMDALGDLKEAADALAKNDKNKAKKWYKRALNYLSKAIESDSLKKLGSSELQPAIANIYNQMKSAEINAENIKTASQAIGAIVDGVHRLVRGVKEKAKAIGARPVARVRRN